MADEEILEIVNRLEQAVEFRKAKSHVEQLECRDHLRIRTNRDGCLSFAAAFLREAIEQTSRTMLTSEKCQTVEGHEQLYDNFGLCVTDIQRFENWGNLKNEIKRGQKKDYANDRSSLIGCALISVVLLVSVFGFIVWVFA